MNSYSPCRFIASAISQSKGILGVIVARFAAGYLSGSATCNVGRNGEEFAGEKIKVVHARKIPQEAPARFAGVFHRRCLRQVSCRCPLRPKLGNPLSYTLK